MTRRSLLAAALSAFEPASLARISLEWVSLDLRNGSESVHWRDPARPVSMGSLLKPFLVLAYAATHTRFPIVECCGSRDHCWLPRGHGRQDIVDALANSCNRYFLRLCSDIDRAALDGICLSYGLKTPLRSLSNERLIGLNGGWPQDAIEVTAAFARLAQNGSEANVRIVLTGMARCSSFGTARDIHIRCYAKTGTAPCSHSIRGQADGFVAAMYPRDQPRAVLLVRHHNTTGAHAASDVSSITGLV